MLLIANRITKKSWQTQFPWLLFAAYLFIFIVALRTYIVWQSINLILGLLSLPFVTTLNAYDHSKRFAIAAIIAMVVLCAIPVKTMLFVSMLFCILFLVENFFGKINMLPVLACLLISPFFQYVANVFGFSIRIVLSTVSGELLSLFGETVSVSGNIITSKGKEFAVDPACMGLNMMITSILIGIVLTGIFQKSYKKALSLPQVFAILIVISALNIASNLIRIILLVKFSILPENSMHEIVGLICLLMYVCIPAIALTRYSVAKFGRSKLPHKKLETIRFYYLLHLLLLLGLGILSFKVDKKVEVSTQLAFTISAIKDSKTEIVGENIFKITSPTTLIYIKPISNFYNAEHNPSICWKGSGYEMKKIKDETISNITIHTATLQKDKAILHTAWWFYNGETATVSQLEWRWKMFKGSKPFAVINITASTKEELEKQVALFFS